jgi:hypothetical protein
MIVDKFGRASIEVKDEAKPGQRRAAATEIEIPA